MDDNIPRPAWPLGIVTDVKTSQDNLVRAATIRTKSGSYVRPVTRIIKLLSVKPNPND